MSFSFQSRKQNIEKLKSEEFDLLIIGGGISGAGVARDAASRGMKVALVEADDYSSGTSSRSSKLVHGGIRYLENYEFGLVFEALRERRNLFDMAPHLVHPLRFCLPLYKGGRVGMFLLGMGMWLYDALSLFEAPKFHERLSPKETMNRFPMMNGKDLLGSYVYSDAYMDDDRLVIETLRSAEDFGATAVNYVKATSGVMKDGKLSEVIAKDLKSGESFNIKARHFVSTVGPWTDIVANDLLGEWKNRMRPTKGVHLTFSRERIPLKEAVVMISDDEKRIVFGIPRHEMVIIGTTDTDFSGDPKDVKTTREDVDYLLEIVNEYFPGANIEEKDIISSYSGVRPLVDDGAETESKTSREHVIISDERNITFLSGGKYTTYRQMAEDTVEEVLKNFSIEEQVRWGQTDTLKPLNPKATEAGIRKAHAAEATNSGIFNVPVETVHKLVERHGEEAYDILDKYLRKTKRGESQLWCLEAYHAINETMCLNLRDFYLRRVPLFLSEKDHGKRFLDDVAAVFQSELGLSDSEVEAQKAELQEHLKHEMGWHA